MFSITIPSSAGTLTVTGANAEEFKANLVWASDNAAQIIAAAPSLGAPPAAAHPGAAPLGPAPSCTHGPMHLVQAGTSKGGKAYGAFYGCPCPDRENQCKSVYL